MSNNQISGGDESKASILKLLEFISKNNGVLNISYNECSYNDGFMHDLLNDLLQSEKIKNLIWISKFSISKTSKKQSPSSIQKKIYENHQHFYKRMHGLLHDSAIWNKLRLIQ